MKSNESPEPAPTISAPEGRPLDGPTLAGLRELGTADFDDLVLLFLQDGAARVAALRNAVKERDAHAIGELAHSLKGSSGTFGAMALAGSCGELQAVASSGDLARADRLMDTVGAEFERAGAALREELSVGPGEPSQD